MTQQHPMSLYPKLPAPTHPPHSGVPQVTLLYSLFMQDYVVAHSSNTIIKFADKTTA